MTDPEEIVEIGGVRLPRERLSCPGCGRLYGHHRTRVCSFCDECSTCCSCEAPTLLTAVEFVTAPGFSP